jgi:hypothetical protein
VPSGGARNRSGPQPDPNSGRSDTRGLVFTALPAEGYRGEIPDFPLPDGTNRETELWTTAWRTPQACAWAAQPWRIYSVAQWVRWSVLSEDHESTAANVTAAIRFADQIGMTPAGLKENGWRIAEDKLAERRADKEDADEDDDLRDRFTVVPDGTGG